MGRMALRTVWILCGISIGIGTSGCAGADPPCAGGSSPVSTPGSSARDAVYVGSGNPYDAGPLTVRAISIAQCENGAPRSMVVYAPAEAGSYAVVVYQHGLTVNNTASSGILRHLAGHGFVVVAPLMYESGTDALLGILTEAEEANTARAVLDWLPGNLDAFMGVHAATERLGLGGHSRGGKIVWLELAADPTLAMAVAGVEPVDGTGYPLGGQPRLINGPFAFAGATLILGTGTGGPCAPKGDNHLQFYEASASPAWYVNAPTAGHADMLDENSPDFARIRDYCGSGDNPPGMLRLAGGQLAAFFRYSLQGDATALAYLTDVAAAPIEIVVETK